MRIWLNWSQLQHNMSQNRDFSYPDCILVGIQDSGFSSKIRIIPTKLGWLDSLLACIAGSLVRRRKIRWGKFDLWRHVEQIQKEKKNWSENFSPPFEFVQHGTRNRIHLIEFSAFSQDCQLRRLTVCITVCFLQMVNFRVKVWATYIVFLSNGIFCFQSRGQGLLGVQSLW